MSTVDFFVLDACGGGSARVLLFGVSRAGESVCVEVRHGDENGVERVYAMAEAALSSAHATRAAVCAALEATLAARFPFRADALRQRDTQRIASTLRLEGCAVRYAWTLPPLAADSYAQLGLAPRLDERASPADAVLLAIGGGGGGWLSVRNARARVGQRCALELSVASVDQLVAVPHRRAPPPLCCGALAVWRPHERIVRVALRTWRFDGAAAAAATATATAADSETRIFEWARPTARGNEARDADEAALLADVLRALAPIDVLVGHRLRDEVLVALCERAKALCALDDAADDDGALPAHWSLLGRVHRGSGDAAQLPLATGRVDVDVGHVARLLGRAGGAGTKRSGAPTLFELAGDDDVRLLQQPADANAVLDALQRFATRDALGDVLALAAHSGLPPAHVARASRVALVDALVLRHTLALGRVPPPPPPAAGSGRGRAPKVRGGLVLDAVRGQHRRPALLLDFASFYPSIVVDERLGDDALRAALGVLLDARASGGGAALKLLANAVIGCLRSQLSRFYAPDVARRLYASARRRLREAACEHVPHAARQVGVAALVVGGTVDSLLVVVDGTAAAADALGALVCAAASNAAGRVALRMAHRFEHGVAVFSRNAYVGLGGGGVLHVRGVHERQDCAWLRAAVDGWLAAQLVGNDSANMRDEIATVARARLSDEPPGADLVGFASGGEPRLAGTVVATAALLRRREPRLDAALQRAFAERLGQRLEACTLADAPRATEARSAVVAAATTADIEDVVVAPVQRRSVVVVDDEPDSGVVSALEADPLVLPLCLRRFATRAGPDAVARGAPHLRYHERLPYYRGLRSLGATDGEATAHMLHNSASAAKRREHALEIARFAELAERARRKSVASFAVDGERRGSAYPTCTSLVHSGMCPFAAASSRGATLAACAPHLDAGQRRAIERSATREHPIAACAHEYAASHGGEPLERVDRTQRHASQHARHYVAQALQAQLARARAAAPASKRARHGETHTDQ